jgi:hypothetical protein
MFRRSREVVQRVRGDLRLLWIAAAVIAAGLGVGKLIVAASDGGSIKDPSKLLANLAWITLGFFVVLAFRRAIEQLLRTLHAKVASAQEFSASAGPFTVKVGVENVRVPAPGQDVRLTNVALLHTSFLRSRQERRVR